MTENPIYPDCDLIDDCDSCGECYRYEICKSCKEKEDNKK